MKNLKCKICGGSLEPLANGDLKCDSCGTIAARADEEKKRQAGLSDSADTAKKLWTNGNFSSAYLIYENILTKNPRDVEVRWNLLLCRYGVLYQFDELTGENLPTVNRMRYDSILKDPDYLAALKYGTKRQKEQYKREAGLIADIQKRYLAIAQKEKPYDVFISFKAENGDGTRSRDSVIGQEIYNSLTEHGLRVFYSRITLENKGGEEFEPYIFSALNTAKVLLLIGTKKEHILAPWVANEWQRYLTFMQEKPGRSLLPVYEGMELSAFPAEIPVREAVDYGAQGALAELTQGVLSITGKGVMVEAKETRSAIVKLTEGLRQAVEKGDFSQAKEIANEVLDLDAENSDAYYYLLLAYFEVGKATALSDVEEDWTENRYYQRALKYADPARKQLLEAVRQRWEMRLEDERKNRIQREEAKRREKAVEEAIAKGKKKMEERDYQAAFDILSKAAAGNPEADRLIEISKKGIEAAELLSDENIVDNTIKREYPKDYFKMERLGLAANNAIDSTPLIQGLVLLCGVVLFALAFFIGTHTSMSSRQESIWGYIWMFVGPILMVVLVIAGLIFMGMGLVNLIRAVYGQHIRKAYDMHMKNVIGPLRKSIWDKIREEYVPWLGEGIFNQLEKEGKV